MPETGCVVVVMEEVEVVVVGAIGNFEHLHWRLALRPPRNETL